jgi:hypothetical protein
MAKKFFGPPPAWSKQLLQKIKDLTAKSGRQKNDKKRIEPEDATKKISLSAFLKPTEGKEKKRANNKKKDPEKTLLEKWIDLSIIGPDYRKDWHETWWTGIRWSIPLALALISIPLITWQLEKALGPYPLPELSLPPSEQAAESQTLAQIQVLNPFKVKMVEETKQQEEKKKSIDLNRICDSAQSPTSLSFTLMNTTVLLDRMKSVATIKDSSNAILVLRQGDKISEQAEIGKIERMKIILKNLNTGECEYLGDNDDEARVAGIGKVYNPKEGQKLIKKATYQGIENAGNRFKIKKDVREKVMTDISQVLTQAKAVQMSNPDGSLAFKMTEIVPGSIY